MPRWGAIGRALRGREVCVYSFFDISRTRSRHVVFCSRLGAASQLRGAMHPHGTWGTVGAAAAVPSEAPTKRLATAAKVWPSSSKLTVITAPSGLP